MLDRIILYSIQNKLIIGVFTLALILWGSWSATQLPIDAVPDITNNQVQIITTSPSLAAQEVERLITFPVEINMANIPGLIEVRSISRFGLSIVTVVFTDETDVYWARQQVSERLKTAIVQIPKGVGIPELGPVSSGLGEIYQYVIHAKKGFENKYSPMELRTIQDWIVRRQLIGTKGVAEVSSFGGYIKQYEIAINPDKLRSMNTSLSEVFIALETNNQNAGGAYIEKKPNAWFIRTEGLATSMDDLGKIVVKNTLNGSPVLIRDLASVQAGNPVRYGAMTLNAEGEVVGAIVMMLKGANSNQVIKDVKIRIDQIRKSLPEGVEIEPFLDRTKLVNRAIGTVSTNLIEGALIVIFILVLFLGNFRAGLVVASVIPLAMLFAISLMNFFGVSGNLMSLGAIDFGLIVDGAVIIVEATLHHIAGKRFTHSLSQKEMDEEVFYSASKIRNSAAFGEIIILIVYLPILALSGIEGKMFKPMAQTVAFAILGAFILSLTYVPMVSALLLSKKATQKRTISDRMMDLFQRIYHPLIGFALKKRLLLIIATLLLFASSIYQFGQMGGEFVPTLDEGDFAIETRVLTGSSMSETIDAALKASDILIKKFPDEVIKVVGKIGTSEIPTDPMPVEACDLMVILKEKNEWKAASSRDELAGKMQEALEAIPGVSFGFQQPIQMRFNELMTGARQDVAIKIYGEDLDVLAVQARKLGQLVQGVEGAKDLYIEKVTGLPQIVVAFDRDKIAQFGLNITDINRIVRTAFAGETAGLIFEGEKRFELVVRFQQANRQGIENVRNLFVTTPKGQQIPLSEVANVDFKVGPNQIQRDDAKRRITVAFNVRGRDVESIVGEIEEKVNKGLTLPPGYYLTYGGQFKNLIEARDRLSIAVPIALVLIFVLLYFTFGSIKQSILIFTAIPLSAIGGIWALWFRDMPFSISAGIGFIALFGVAVLNGIVLISEFNQLRKEGFTDLSDIILKGTSHRLRPVLMTAAVASLGFLPMALSNGSGAEVQRPLATVVIGGLISATILTLLVLPAIYYLFEKPGKIKPIAASILVLIAFGLACPFSGALAQSSKTLDLNHAIQLALQNNRSIQGAQHLIESQKFLKSTATEIGKTNFNVMYGQYNSFYPDNNFTVSQSIPFPGTFQKQEKVYEMAVQSAGSQKKILENELIFQVKSTYHQLVFAKSLIGLFKKQDSLYTAFLRSAELKLRTGESNFLEKSMAESQLFELRNRQLQKDADVRILEHKLQTLLHLDETVTNTDARLVPLVLNIPNDSASTVSNPALLYFSTQIQLSEASIRLEKTRLWPDFTVGYFNQSMYGTIDYRNPGFTSGAGKRFQGVTFGVALPLWRKPQLARIQSSESLKKGAQAQLEFTRKNLEGQYAEAFQQFVKWKNSLIYYEKTALPTAKTINEFASKSYRAGNIGYIEFLQAVNKAVLLETEYLLMVNQHNQSILQIEFLIGNPQ